LLSFIAHRLLLATTYKAVAAPVHARASRALTPEPRRCGRLNRNFLVTIPQSALKSE
jgi:hypothetical protein